MEYKGRLYGKVGGQVFPLLNTTDDWEKMENRIKELEAENEALKQANGAEQSESTCNLQNVSNSALPPLTEFATKALDNIADACKYITSGNASHQSKSIEGSAKRNAEFIRKHYC